MFSTIRQSFTWLHRGLGIGLAALLFSIFLFGTLSVFDSELDRWMQPATRIDAPAGPVSLDALMPTIRSVVGDAPDWAVKLPDDRDGRLQVRASGGKGRIPSAADIDPASGVRLPKLATRGASGFFLPFHYSLLIAWAQLGYWIVALATIGALAMLVTGVVIHVRLIPDLFTFRARVSTRRRLLSLHTLTAGAGLPFTAAMALSGLLVSYSNIMPAGIRTVYTGDRQHFFSDVFGNYRRPPAGRPAAMAPLDPMLAEAAQRWGGGRPDVVQVYNWGDANAYIALRRRNGDRITADPGLIHFDGTTGAVLQFTPLRSAIATQRWLTGLHMARFDRTVLRWLYFALGALGCVMIASATLSWIEARRRADGRSALDWFALAVIAGPILATLAYLNANRLLPAVGASRATAELAAFFTAWVLSAVHAAIRVRTGRLSAWTEQCLAIATLATLAAVLNWLSTGDNPFEAIARGRGQIASIDLVLLANAAVATFAARQLMRLRTGRAG